MSGNPFEGAFTVFILTVLGSVAVGFPIFMIYLTFTSPLFERGRRYQERIASKRRPPSTKHGVLIEKECTSHTVIAQTRPRTVTEFCLAFRLDEGETLWITSDGADYESICEGDSGTLFIRDGELLGFYFDRLPSRMTYEEFTKL